VNPRNSYAAFLLRGAKSRGDCLSRDFLAHARVSSSAERVFLFPDFVPRTEFFYALSPSSPRVSVPRVVVVVVVVVVVAQRNGAQFFRSAQKSPRVHVTLHAGTRSHCGSRICAIIIPLLLREAFDRRTIGRNFESPARSRIQIDVSV